MAQLAMQQNSILCRFPDEVLEAIAFKVTLSEPLGPPKGLLPLLYTCKRIYDVLKFDRSSDLYARVFKGRFDFTAVRRRRSPRCLRSSNVALQLKEYCTTLKNIRKGDIYLPDIFSTLRCAFIMATESDGRNACQLEWAGLGPLVDRFVRTRLYEGAATNNGWPEESSINAVALWLMWFTTTRGEFLHPLRPTISYGFVQRNWPPSHQSSVNKLSTSSSHTLSYRSAYVPRLPSRLTTSH